VGHSPTTDGNLPQAESHASLYSGGMMTDLGLLPDDPNIPTLLAEHHQEIRLKLIQLRSLSRPTYQPEA